MQKKKMTKRQIQKIKRTLKEKLNNNKKAYTYSAITIVTIVIASLLINALTSSRAVESTSLLSDQTVNNLEFIQAELENNKLKVVVHNLDKEKEYQLSGIDVTYIDEMGNNITTISGYIGNSIEKDGMKQLVVETDADLTRAKSIRYTIQGQ